MLPVFVLVLYFSRTWWLDGIGAFLVKAGGPARADAVLVLAGDRWGNRILKGAELVREGYAPKVFVSGPDGEYGHYESDLAIEFAEHAGYPASYFVPLTHDARSTREEANKVIPMLRARGIRNVDLVTSDYHTRRAGDIFRRLAPDMQFHVVAAPDHFFAVHGWWQNREGRKIVFLEVTKTIANWFGI